jgi:predicted transglutaminase-like cysteine proteinase
VLLSACVGSNTLECASARQLWAIIQDAKTQHDLATIGHLNRSINLAIKWVPRPWQGVLEAINADGDCKAYATAKYFEDHMVVAVWADRCLILDNRTMVMAPDNQTRYTPLYVLDLHGLGGYSVPVS